MLRVAVVAMVLLISFRASAQTDVIEEKLGKDASKSVNKDNTFTLYKAEKPNASGVPVLHYVVQRNGDKKIVLEGSITMGVIEWSAVYELEESRSLGSEAQQAAGSKRRIDLRPFLK
ncbi:MAG TPA: hypothetical protein VK508_03905 [Cyclobacteriaceae bacterium]|nr:hypothetical protein [Cyclobacteriaceae bacterium]